MSLSSEDSDEFFGSDNFDSISALYSKDIEKKLKPGEYCIFDNFSSIETYLKKCEGDLDVKFDREKAVQKSKKDAIREGKPFERRFLPHQQMIKVEQIVVHRHTRSVLSDNEKLKGPLESLGKWLTEGVRIKVLMRKSHGIRGFVTGIIRLYDKHCNLTLSDVHEQFTRRKFGKSTELALDSDAETEAFKRFKELKLPHPLKDPHTEVRVIDKKRVEVKRRHKLLFIKGDQVAVVMKYTEGHDSY